jgi:hypothetical protein
VQRKQNNTNEGDDDRIRGELNGFAVGAKWRELTPNEVPVSNPESRGNLRAPTAPEGEEFNDRHNFDCTFIARLSLSYVRCLKAIIKGNL